ncbi:transcription repressor OFP6-like [Henckelia pumila]|uniref:transcription repressor OFP6-like n=1 Tax=Henckelia pumila TaxID=405737 RepID=UPI003C6DC98C
MSKLKKDYILNSVAVDLGCISTCRKPKISSILGPNPKTHRPRASSCSAASPSSWSTTTTSSVFNTPRSVLHSDSTYSEIKSLKAVLQGFGRIGGESVAVEKDSDDPYLDFRHSMLQMILEKQIYAKDDLKELLHCFLQLNSPYYHGIIVRAFTEIWNGVYSIRPNAASSSSPNFHGT